MYLVALCIFLHINLASLIRMLQGTTPFSVNLVKFKTLTSPWILPSFSIIRLVSLLLMIYNSFVVSMYFYTGVLLWYFLWFAAFILWVKPFTCCDFTTANKTMAVCTLYSTVLCIEMPIFFPNAIWSVYCMYLSAWYKWCLPI
jgi:hypothetical protein